MHKAKIAAFFCYLTKKRRTPYKLQKQKRLTNTTPSIIGNNCVCGAIYRDLNLQYASPTANVLIDAEDFFRFVSHLEYYLTCVPEKFALEGVSYPVGILRNGDEQVVLHFMHDSSFESAKEKWGRRCARVDLDNLYIIFQQEFPKHRIRLRKSNIWYKRFKNINYPNKRMILNTWLSFDKEVVPLRKQAFFKGKSAIEYPTKHSKKKLMDVFDYVSFLNKNQK